MPHPSPKVNVLVLHHPEDKAYLQEIVELIDIPEEVKLTHHHWEDEQAAEADWLRQRVAEAELIMLLISREFCVSAIWTSIKRDIGDLLAAQEERKRVIPVILREAPWQRRMPDLKPLKKLPSDYESSKEAGREVSVLVKNGILRDDALTELDNHFWDIVEAIVAAGGGQGAAGLAAEEGVPHISPVQLNAKYFASIAEEFAQLDFQEQRIDFYDTLSQAELAGFLISGPPYFGHEWFFRLCLSELTKDEEVFEPFYPYAINENNSCTPENLWMGLGQLFGLSFTTPPDQVAKRMVEQALEQTVVIKLNNAGEAAPADLQQVICDLVSRLDSHYQRIKPPHRILLFVMDERGQADLACLQNQIQAGTRLRLANLQLKPLKSEDLMDWYKSNYLSFRRLNPPPRTEFLPQDKAAREKLLEDLLKKGRGGAPLMVLDLLGQYFHCHFSMHIMSRFQYQELSY